MGQFGPSNWCLFNPASPLRDCFRDSALLPSSLPQNPAARMIVRCHRHRRHHSNDLERQTSSNTERVVPDNALTVPHDRARGGASNAVQCLTAQVLGPLAACSKHFWTPFLTPGQFRTSRAAETRVSLGLTCHWHIQVFGPGHGRTKQSPRPRGANPTRLAASV